MFDAFGKFANGIIGHEASNQGGGGGTPMFFHVTRAKSDEEEEPELHLRKDSLRLSPLQITMYAAEGQASGKAFQAATRIQ